MPTKGEILKKKLVSKDVFHYIDQENSIDYISKEVFKKIDEEIHYPRGFEEQHKYKTIRKFVYKGFKGNLPVGVVKSYRLGYGFTKTLNPFAFYINDNFNIEEVIIEKDGSAKLDKKNKKLYLSEKNLEYLNKSFGEIYKKNRAEINLGLQIGLHKLFPKTFKAPEKTYVENDLASSLAKWGNSIDEFSDADKNAIQELFDKLSLSTDFLSTDTLAKTKEIVDSKFIKKTLEKFEEIITLKVDSDNLEQKWQVFLRDNNWVFSTIFAQPVILHKREAYVGGKTLDNTNGKYNDFLLKNLSDNVSFLEIKTHKTKLTETSAYRGNDVFGVSKDLSGSVAQVLNQRDNFQKEFYNLKGKNKSKENFETFNSKCIVLIGNLADLSEEQRYSFEIQRNNYKDVEIITFDELKEKIQSLQYLLNQK